ncbi:MAG: NUMOD4 domain-containing protein, partial [Ferruginibacter sp.]
MNQKKEKYQSALSNEFEYWKEIPECNGLYLISSFGRVVSLRYGLLKTPIMNTGYPHCNVTKNGKTCRILIHRVVGR